jgi:N-acetylglucosaminyl-diphospho-decaprenol L-rhamnosyltransferase
MRRGEFQEIGGFDESLPLFYSDVDLCLRIWRMGRPIHFLAEACVAHVGSASVVRHSLWRAEFMRNQVRYFRKNKGFFAAQFARAVILLAAIIVGVRTLLGPRSDSEKRELLGQLRRTIQIAIGR